MYSVRNNRGLWYAVALPWAPGRYLCSAWHPFFAARIVLLGLGARDGDPDALLPENKAAFAFPAPGSPGTPSPRRPADAGGGTLVCAPYAAASPPAAAPSISAAKWMDHMGPGTKIRSHRGRRPKPGPGQPRPVGASAATAQAKQPRIGGGCASFNFQFAQFLSSGSLHRMCESRCMFLRRLPERSSKIGAVMNI